jgi:hypothetical protein
MEKSIRLHDDSYLMLVEMAREQQRKLVTVVEIAIEKMYRETHPEPISDEEALERR